MSATLVPGSPLSRAIASSTRRCPRCFAVDLHDAVAGEDAGPIGGRAVHRAEHAELAVVDGDLDADAAELALHAGAEVVQLLGADVAE